MTSFEDLLVKYITKIEIAILNQQASIHNIENWVGQIVAALSNRPYGAFPSDTEKNLREQVLAIKAIYSYMDCTPLIKVTPCERTYVLPILFPQRLQMQPKEEQAQVITIRSGIQLLKINIGNKQTESYQVPTTGEKQVDQYKKPKEMNQQKLLDSPKVQEIVPINIITHQIPFSQ